MSRCRQLQALACLAVGRVVLGTSTDVEATAVKSAETVPELSRFTSCSGATGRVSEETWAHLRDVAYSDTGARDFGIIVDSRSDVFEFFRDVLQQQVMVDVSGAVSDCVFGVISLLLLTLPMVDDMDGIEKARESLSLADHLFFRFSDFLPRSAWPLEIAQHFGARLLLGEEPTDCAGSTLKIFIYNIGNLTRQRLRTAFGMMGAPTHFHAYLERSSCVVHDPDEADLFFIPAYHGKQYSKLMEEIIHANEVSEIFPYLDRRRGADHFFIVGANLPDWVLLEPLRHASLLTVESYQVNDGVPRWYSPWKDVMIPGYIDRWRIAAMRNFSKPSHERGYLVAFHGNHPGTHYLYVKHNASIRTRIIEGFSSEPDCTVGGPVGDFFERMGRSHFCLVPRGSSAWTIHLYESFFFGCIPVILSDNFEMPFQELVDWPSLSLKWPEDRVGPELLAHLRSIPLTRVAEMKQRLDEASCYFDYHRGWGGTPAPGLGRWAPFSLGLVALGSDCPFQEHGDATTAATCRDSCDQLEGCNLVNFRPSKAGSGEEHEPEVELGACILRTCKDPAQPSLTGSADGWEVWARVGMEAHLCSPFAAALRGLEARVRHRPFTHGPHWY
eukprot:TRINITY_DN55706_c0_g1_i1.p1 TRINITY_DN55706_c0_g1~~TRINITY_DN55706_c0_g1_i1.p1  ORF type:complete len:613 (+),score=54.83 TRINITY_DN55706_c0_g1_i1:201-2039(+)